METETPKYRAWLADLIYLLVWLIPLVAAVWLAPLVLPSSLLILLGGLTASTYILATVVWSALVFVAWIAIGDGSSAHEANFARYKSIWVSFILISLALFLGSYLSYRGVVNRVEALRGTAALVEKSIDKLAYWATAGEEQCCPGSDGCSTTVLPNGLHKYSICLNSRLKDASTFQEAEEPPIDVVRKLRYIAARVETIEWRTKQLQRLLKELVAEEQSLEKEGQAAKGMSFRPTSYIVNELATATDEISATFASLNTAAERARPGGQAEMEVFKQGLAFLIVKAEAAGDLIEAARMTVVASKVNLLAPFVLVTVLYVVFLLFPWVLLFLFLLRKREYLVNEKAQLLCRLDLAQEFLKRSPRQETRDAAGRGVVDRGTVASEISEHAFRNSEYVVSLVFLTAITATLWYFFFYPYATSGLAYLISVGGGVKAFAAYLADSATPITFGFTGAYFFIVQMLLRRYFASDLNPKAYIYAIVRLLTVFILGMVFQLATTHFNWTPVFASVVTFAVGIFPMAGLRWILRWAGEKVPFFTTSEGLDRYPLTKLDGLNTWHEARLLEEKVENAQNLATAPLDDLIIHTNFSPLQLVDWVDQALLFVHTQERWDGALRAVGIRTATDLIDNTRKDDGDQFDPDTARNLAAAINAAQAFIAPEAEHPREVARLAAAELYASVADVAGTAQEACGISGTLMADKPETLDAIVALQTRLRSLAEAAKGIKDEKVKEVTQATEKLPADGGDLVKQAKEAGGEVEKSAAGLSVEVDAAKQAVEQLNRKQAETLAQLSEVNTRINAVCAAAAQVKAQAISAVKTAQQGATGAAAQAEWTALLTALEATQKASEQALKEAQEVREAAGLLDKDKPETLNMVMALQTQLNALVQAVSDAQAKVKDARAAMEGLQASQPLLAEARKNLDAAAESVNSLITTTADAKDAAAPLDIDSPATMVGLAGAKESVEKARKTAEEAKTRGQAAAGALQAASAPPQITAEILQVMVTTIEKGPNINKLQSFWKN